MTSRFLNERIECWILAVRLIPATLTVLSRTKKGSVTCLRSSPAGFCGVVTLSLKNEGVCAIGRQQKRGSSDLKASSMLNKPYFANVRASFPRHIHKFERRS